MGTVADILTLAHDQLGSSGARYWNWYTDSVRPSQGSFVDGNATPYCAEYVSWLLAMTGTPCEYFPNSCAFDARDIPEGGRIYGQDLRPGDLVAFDWDEDYRGDHVGIVRSVQDWGCNTNEGNTGSDMCVHERQRTWDVILFGIRPEYEDAPNPQPGGLAIDGYAGPATVSRMQQWMGTTVDGIISGQSHSDDEYRPNVVAVDYYGQGSDMIRAMQRYLGCNADGYWGYQTSKALQWLVGVSQDGYFGPESVRALQSYLNAL